MPDFSSFGDLANQLQRVARGVPNATQKALVKIGKKVERAAKDKIGHYQSASGEFAAWVQLEDATQAARARMGFTPNDPLLRTGELYGSISHIVERASAGWTLTLGSDINLGLWQEMGTRTIPPRPFIGPAMFENEQYSQDVLAQAIAKLFAKV